MKALLQRYAERIDAASIRERVLVFLAAALVLVFVADAALIQPLRTKQKRLAAETAEHQKELTTIQAQVQRLVGQTQVDPDAGSRARAAALREQLKSLKGRVAEEQRRFTPPERMRAVLQEVLERNKGLVLVDLTTLPVVPVASQKAGGTARAGMYRHGIEFTVVGTYSELYDYLRALEELPTQLYWARADLAVAEYPLITLKLTVHTVSFDRAWLIL